MTLPNQFHFERLALDQGITTPTDTPRIVHVEAAFNRIDTRGEFVAAHSADAIYPYRYTSLSANLNGIQNHFQGLVRLGRYLLISGGDWQTPRSDLFVIDLASRPDKGPWWSNLPNSRTPPPEDKIVTAICLDHELWHAGGMDHMGSVVAVPIEYSPPATLDRVMGFDPPYFGDVERSKIIFLNCETPETPQRIDVEIERVEAKAGAVALTRLPNQLILVGVWSDSDSKPPRLDLYLSLTPNLRDGFRPPQTWEAKDVHFVGEQDRNFSKFQSIHFLLQDDGKLYLVGLHNTSDFAPTIGGRDYADLFLLESIEIHQMPATDSSGVGTPRVTKVANVQVYCKHSYCNLDAAACVHRDGQELIVYSAYHWRTGDGVIRLSEFRPLVKGVAGTLTKKNAWVELYDEPYFRGRRLAVRGTAHLTQPNFDKVNAQGSGFEDNAESARYQLPTGTRVRLFEHKNFKKPFSFELEGTGKVIEHVTLPKGVKGKISSMQFEDSTE